jgi:hypothetical protein
VEFSRMKDDESMQLLRANMREWNVKSDELLKLKCRLEHLPLALVQAAAFMEGNSSTVGQYSQLLDKGDKNVVDLLSEELDTVGRDSQGVPHAVTEARILSFKQIQYQTPFAAELLSLMSFFDRQTVVMEFLGYYSERQSQGKCGEISLEKALGIRRAFSFVTMVRDQSLDVHRLVQVVTRKWLAREGETGYFAGQALLAVSHIFPMP